jgi:hypothetical protein
MESPERTLSNAKCIAKAMEALVNDENEGSISPISKSAYVQSAVSNEWDCQHLQNCLRLISVRL